MRTLPFAAPALAALLLAGCVTKTEPVTQTPTAATRTVVNLGGTVNHRSHDSLPDGAEVSVEAYDAANAGAGATPVSQSRWNTAGEQVPLNFTLTIDQAWLQRGKRLAIRASIKVGGRTLYATPVPFILDGGVPPVPLELIVVPAAR